MNPNISSLENKKSKSAKRISTPEESFIETPISQNPKDIIDNPFYSNMVNRFIKFIVLLFLMLGVWLGKAYGTVIIRKNIFFYEFIYLNNI